MNLPKDPKDLSRSLFAQPSPRVPYDRAYEHVSSVHMQVDKTNLNLIRAFTHDSDLYPDFQENEIRLMGFFEFV